MMKAQNPGSSLVVSDKDKSELSGNVKSVTGYTYEARRVNGTIQKTSLFNTATVSFDKHGFLTEQIVAAQTTKYVNEYNPQGRLASVKTYIQGQYDGCSRYTYKPSQVIETLFDEYGSEIGTIIHSQGKSVGNDNEIKTTTFFNSKNMMTKVIADVSTPNGTISMTTVPTYNSHSAIEKLTMTSPEGTVVIRYSDYKYDPHGNWTYRVKSAEGMGERVEERRIEYYQ